MPPRTVWWLMDAKTPPIMVGSLTEAEALELYEMIDGHS
jgi:hypothetical protein